MKIYTAEYICRRCKATDDGPHTGNLTIVVGSLCGLNVPGNPVEPTSVHYCEDGGIGLSDLQGFRGTDDAKGKP